VTQLGENAKTITMQHDQLFETLPEGAPADPPAEAPRSAFARTGILPSQAIRAMMPLSEMFGYATELRSATKGRGAFTMEFDHYARVSASLAEELIKAN